MTISERDKNYLWHPLTQHKTHPENLAITTASGAVFTDEHGKQYVDGIASWYTCMYGHCNPYITKKLQDQLNVLDHVIFSGLTHEPAVRLSEMLIGILPEGQEKLFFSDNGSTAVEVAIKMSLQYHFNQSSKRNTIIAFEDGFHGDTFGAMSVSGLSVYNGPFEDFFLNVKRIPVPDGTNNKEVLAKFRSLLETEAVASFIFEPLVQGAAGMKMYDAEGLEALMVLAREFGVLNIADEVMTGFGKTGTLFATDQLQVKPDMICLSKALTAGMLPMAVTSCSSDVYQAFYSRDLGKGFFHGHTYTANPLACTAAIAGIELLLSEEFQGHIQRIKSMHLDFDKRIKNLPGVRATRQLGVIYALDLDVEMERYGDLRQNLYNYFMSRGAFLRPLGNTIYILAPYTTTKAQMEVLYTAIEGVLEKVPVAG
ncbi:adenosylmethionine--8-amino-7-oxononanoate transaminase [Robertkochia flava]|uniref:adenosylmethionine--8-amino-7-oxononanoate transaminase n=1 Tax=Robertkochia flava TaxID=3447986 RepID=UPI001CC9A73E|nr:adenosylmethionine--8-amino-7-oxononanoate transaminase [Robertkochia marina]